MGRVEKRVAGAVETRAKKPFVIGGVVVALVLLWVVTRKESEAVQVAKPQKSVPPPKEASAAPRPVVRAPVPSSALPERARTRQAGPLIAAVIEAFRDGLDSPRLKLETTTERSLFIAWRERVLTDLGDVGGLSVSRRGTDDEGTVFCALYDAIFRPLGFVHLGTERTRGASLASNRSMRARALRSRSHPVRLPTTRSINRRRSSSAHFSSRRQRAALRRLDSSSYETARAPSSLSSGSGWSEDPSVRRGPTTSPGLRHRSRRNDRSRVHRTRGRARIRCGQPTTSAGQVRRDPCRMDQPGRSHPRARHRHGRERPGAKPDPAAQLSDLLKAVAPRSRRDGGRGAQDRMQRSSSSGEAGLRR